MSQWLPIQDRINSQPFVKRYDRPEHSARPWRPIRHRADLDHRGNAALLSRLRHERDREPRAPDVRDDLKPLHGAFFMHRLKRLPLEPQYVKSARPVADVMGKYHPHGDASIYDALVRMAQDWSMRVPLIDGKAITARSTAIRPRRCATRNRVSARSRMNCWRTSTKRPSISRTPMTPRQDRGFCRRAFPIFWSMAPAASPSAWRPISRRTISRRSSTAVSP